VHLGVGAEHGPRLVGVLGGGSTPKAASTRFSAIAAGRSGGARSAADRRRCGGVALGAIDAID
jgi:hypothetical protein